MRKLKLQVQVTVDGFVAGPEGQLDWMTGVGDDEMFRFMFGLTDSCDTILMGRKMAAGFTGYWEDVVDNHPESPEFDFAKKMVNYPKVVFSKKEKEIPGRNVTVENGDLVSAVNALKTQPGKDIIVYGGASFVSSLIENNLVDELNLFINPVAIGEGMRIFSGRTNLQLISSKGYGNGEVINVYTQVK